MRRISHAARPPARMVLAALGCLVLASSTSVVSAQPESRGRIVQPRAFEHEEPVRFRERDLSGPRFGVTYVAGNGEIWQRMQEEDMDRLLSQFGWHFEQQVVPEGGGPEFVVEFVPMISGVEYGKVVPNLTLAMGVRTPGGWEFGLGPNLLATGLEDSEDLHTSLVMAVGRSIDYGGVSIPLNLAFASNPDGQRVSLIVGYAIRR